MPTSRASRERRRAESDERRYDNELAYDEEQGYDGEQDYDEEPADDYAEDDAAGQAQGRIGTAGAAAQAAREELADLIGRQAEGVVAVEPAQDGWTVSVEVVEDRRIPSSADILAIYQADIDADGELTSYRRITRYARGQGNPGGGR